MSIFMWDLLDEWLEVWERESEVDILEVEEGILVETRLVGAFFGVSLGRRSSVLETGSRGASEIEASLLHFSKPLCVSCIG